MWKLNFKEFKKLATDLLNIDRLIFSGLFHQKLDLLDKNNFN